METHIRSKRGVVWGVGVSLVLLVGCGDSVYSQSGSNGIARDQVARGPVAPRRFVTTPQTAVDTAAATVAPWTTIAFPADVSLDARLLIITADGTDPAFTAIVEGLQYLGTPFDVLNATTDPELTADRLATGSRGHYYGIFLDRGNLSTGTVSAFSTAEWGVLTDYEARFQVRRVALYAYPEAIYGLTPVGAPIDTTMGPLSIHCTASGAAVFADTNCTSGITVVGAYAYPAMATGTATVPILVDGVGNVLGATFTDLFSREYLALTFAQSPSLVHSLSLIHDLVRWVTRGVFLGERHVYLTSQIDDLFLASDLYPYCSDCVDGGIDGAPPAGSAPVIIGDAGALPGLTYRITELDMQALADWQAATRASPLTADLRFDWALNGVGASASDPLTTLTRTLGSTFKWISHTWDHALLDNISYTNALAEFTLNDNLVSALGLQPYDIRSLVTPSISGLDNPDAINAAFDAGIRYMVGDTSVAGWNNPTPNAGIYSTFQPQVLIIPRRPTNLFYNVSTPDKWQLEYNAIYRSYWGRDLSYSEILDFESNLLLQDLLRGANDPWMFHQANTRNYGGGQSLLTDLHGSLLAKYAAASKVPVVSDTMDVLGNRVAMRMNYDRSLAAGVIGPGAQLTVSVVNAASVPVTGLCTPTSETYAGDTIAYVDLPAGGAATFPLGNCNAGAGGADAGADGAAGNTGVGGTLGSGGAVGVGGQVGTGGAVATGMGGDGAAGGTGGAVNGGVGGNLGTGGMLGAGGGLGAGGAVSVGSGGGPGSGGALGMGGDPGSGAGGAGGQQVGVGGAGSGDGVDSGALSLGGANGTAGFTGSDGGAETGGEGGRSADAGNGGVSGDAAIGGMNGALSDAGQTPTNPSPNGGCSCSLAERSPGASAFGLIIVVAGLMTRGRRRARATAARKTS